MDLPVFRYHPDPVATGSAVATDEACSLCGVERGVRYVGPVYGDRPDILCLHCIASGEAAKRLGAPGVMPAMFSDAIHVPDDVPAGVVDEVTMRTPGFSSWQQAGWLYHCADAAAFLGNAGYADLAPHPAAVESLRQDRERLGWPAEQFEEFVTSLDKDGEPTAYLFRCLHCGTYLASWDIG
ncbi:MAG: CbrC family protein [Nocardiopsaceae bacterium]|nr:CbrC family protein [Nocardiopsaceae bacterium]